MISCQEQQPRVRLEDSESKARQFLVAVLLFEAFFPSSQAALTAAWCVSVPPGATDTVAYNRAAQLPPSPAGTLCTPWLYLKD